ncbi:MAG TPA: hypothetical protein VLY23_01585 [Candidatus Acidoferrum sp.]|nr:hypothetical protein [Candidatus Acidoferrum sp.]
MTADSAVRKRAYDNAGGKAPDFLSAMARRGCCCGEAPGREVIDALRDCVYSRKVPARKIQVGQVWKKDGSGETFLVTKIYNEALATFALLRKTGAETEPPIRVRVSRAGASVSIPGFSYTQESDDF